MGHFPEHSVRIVRSFPTMKLDGQDAQKDTGAYLRTLKIDYKRHSIYLM
jgi:hypothetical protein